MNKIPVGVDVLAVGARIPANTCLCTQGKEANMVNVLAETEVVSPSLPSSYTLLTQREPGTQVGKLETALS